MSSETTTARAVDDVVIARIVRARGIRGEVSCTIETDHPDRFSTLKEVSVVMPDGTPRELEVKDHWFHKDRVILRFEGIDTMTAARDLVGGCLVITEKELWPLAQGEFFEHQLIGSIAVDEQSQGLGQVTGLLRTGGTDILVVQNENGRELLIPFADEICINIDVTAKRITVKPPDGLLEL